MAYRIAGIDVHKAMVAVVTTDVEVENDWDFDRRAFGTTPSQLRLLTEWLNEHEVEEVVMESTAQYWRPVWDALECDWQPRQRARVDAKPTTGALHLAQALSNQGRHGRKRDFPDAERLVKRLVAQELTLSFVPDVTQRLWRTVTRRKYQLRAIASSSRIAWRRSSRRPTSSCRRWCRICWASAHGGCFARSPTAPPIRPRLPPSAVPGSTPRRNSYAMPSAPRQTCTRCTAGWWRTSVR
jgi:Transposase